jgi:hypothetical protein
MGEEETSWEFYISFSLFRLASIAQGVYKRFLQGNASSTSANMFDKITKIVAETAWKIADRSYKHEKENSDVKYFFLNIILFLNLKLLFPLSPKVAELKSKLLKFMEDYIYPNEFLFHSYMKSLNNEERWTKVWPELENLKGKAKKAGLWNMFLPSEGPKLSIFEYAKLCEIIGNLYYDKINAQRPIIYRS